MNSINESNWTEDESRRLRELGEAEASPSPAARTRITQSLAQAGLLAGPRRVRNPWIPWASAAALAVLGFAAGRESVAVSEQAALTMPVGAGQKYVLLLSGAGSTTPAENAARRKEYGDWLQDLSRRGMGVDGQELVGERHDLPEGPGGPPVVGYFVITARTEAEALEVAKTSPHLRHGGGVTVSAIR